MQTMDISFGRQTDGGMPWIFFDEPTPGYSNMANECAGGNQSARPGDSFLSQSGDRRNIHFWEPFTGRMTDMAGKEIWSGQEVVKD